MHHSTSSTATPPAGDLAWIARAVAAVQAFGPDRYDETTIGALLSMWRHRLMLENHQVAEAAAHFTTAGCAR